MEPSFARLQQLVTVAELGNISRAAEQLRLSQPALSRSIAALERHYGATLFDRARTGVVATAVGRQIIAEAAEVIRAAQALDRNARVYAGGRGGTVSIGIGPLVASLLLPRLATNLIHANPGMKLNAVVRSPSELTDDLASGGVELIVGNGWSLVDLPGVQQENLGQVALVLLARPGHPLTEQPAISLSDIARYPLASATLVAARGLEMSAGALVCDNYDLLTSYVAVSDAVCLCSAAIMAGEISANRLTMLDVPEFAPLTSSISVMTRIGRTLSPGALAIIERCRSMLAESVSGSG